MVNNISFNKNTMSILLSIATNTNSVEREKNKCGTKRDSDGSKRLDLILWLSQCEETS